MIKLINVTKSFKKGEFAIKDLNFTLEAGQTAGLIGPNGAGKSTTIKCIAGLLRLDSGQITIAGYPHTSIDAKRRMAYVPEMPEPYPLLTAWEHMQFVAQAYGIRNWKPRAEELFERFEMVDNRNKLGRELSKGMRQKVSICAAFLHDPDFIMLDEPLVGLDPKAIREVKNLIEEEKTNGKTLLISTHILDTVERFADRLLIMRTGELIWNDSPLALRQQFGAEVQTLEDIFFTLTQKSADDARV
ncbi:ABC transporter ATP-binding protein [Thermaurantimonas aggregans]|uniref:ABC transporter ATP-binding protein n=1 Tax=Thermaurantimonas aggregans TaxID=2173829 RepID=A0A401XLD7_9FLAO|nr:ABC transporter ATP-binding protein [Thermaurantimonas aggregans]MCX8148297.1 ABC transporter ATP-binding protein [Thermaurantimonas aggregans]GCD77801.1 ABC transporter ATP-binding protein [Thermaurantimonas aggregans]